MNQVLLSIAIGLIPSLIWLLFFLKEEGADQTEPKRMIFLAFLGGGLITIVTLFIQIYFNAHLAVKLGIAPYTIPSIVALATAEEIFKFLVVLILISKSKFFNEPLDAMTYMIAAALGFAAVENVSAVFNIIGNPNEDTLGSTTQVIAIRLIGATLLHVLASAALGYYWAKGILHCKPYLYIPFGLFMAVILHSIFNYLIINTGPMVYPVIFVTIVALFIFVDISEIKKEEKEAPKCDI